MNFVQGILTRLMPLFLLNPALVTHEWRVDKMPKPAEVKGPRRFAALGGNAKTSAIALHRFSAVFANSFIKFYLELFIESSKDCLEL
jgi:hypothetical protein